MLQIIACLHELSPEDSNAILKACDLPNKDEYLEDEAERFRKCRELIESGKTYKQAAAYFRRLDKNVASPDGTDGVEELEGMLNISELLALASAQSGTRISFKEVGQILDACGLAELDQYTSEQGDRFLEACDLIKKQNKSYQEVATHFGQENTPSADLQSQLQQIVAKFSGSAMTAEAELLDLASRIVKKQVDATDIDIDQLMKRLYLMQVSEKAVKRREQNDTIFAEIEQRILDQIEGKSPLQSLQASWDWQMNSLPPSSPKPMSLPEGSDNGTNAS